jgi:hypothetical protein
MLTKRALAGFAIIMMASWGITVVAADSAINDDVILSQVLKGKYEDGGFTVVAPMTTLRIPLPTEDEVFKKKVMQDLSGRFKSAGYEIDQLLKRLIDKNKSPTKLELKSSQTDGYIIDYDGKFAKYRGREGGGWKKWYEENPKAHGITRVSLPVHDERTGYVLVYKGNEYYKLAGAGYLILYKYSEGKLEELAKVRLWQA